VKHENHTPIGAFKVRGGLTYLTDLVQSGRQVRGLITATRGNHGQSIPYAAGLFNLPVTVVVPEGNAAEKNAAMEALGAKLVIHGRDFDEARIETMRLAERDGLDLVPPFHPALVRGVATYALELFTARPDLDTVYVPVGMGSGISGLITVRDLLGLRTEIVGVVSAHAPAYALSFAAGHVVTTGTAHTFADGFACREPNGQALEIILKGAARIVQVTDDEIADAMRILHADTHNMAEGAGAASLAALIQERDQSPDRLAGKRFALILSGGNVDRDIYAEVLAGRTPKPWREAEA
jgi:threonine dehydratase